MILWQDHYVPLTQSSLESERPKFGVHPVVDGCIVQITQMDNAGENQMLKEKCIKEGLGITFEQTVRNTLQQNGIVECAFTTP